MSSFFFTNKKFNWKIWIFTNGVNRFDQMNMSLIMDNSESERLNCGEKSFKIHIFPPGYILLLWLFNLCLYSCTYRFFKMQSEYHLIHCFCYVTGKLIFHHFKSMLLIIIEFFCIWHHIFYNMYRVRVNLCLWFLGE